MSFNFISTVYAACDPTQSNVNLGDCIDLGNGTSLGEVYSTPSVLVNTLVRNLFVFAGIILFFMIMFAGFKFISQGTKGKDEAKSIITTAVVGFIIMFAAYWIVQILQILTGVTLGF